LDNLNLPNFGKKSVQGTLIILIILAMYPIAISATNGTEPLPNQKPLSALIKEKSGSLQFQNSPVTAKDLSVTHAVQNVKVDSNLLSKLASLDQKQTIPLIVQFSSAVAKSSDIRKGSGFVQGFATRTLAVNGGSAAAVVGYVPQVLAIEVNATGSQANAIIGNSQVVRVYDGSITYQVTNYYSTQYQQAQIAWASHSQGQGSIVAVLDSGWDNWASYTTGICPPNGCSPHPDLTNLASFNPFFSIRDFVYFGDAYDFYGHGTHVEGIAVGQGIVDSSQTGMAPQAKLMVGKVCDDSGSCPTAAIVNGLVWASGIDPSTGLPTGLKANVVNMSFGGSCGSDYGTNIIDQVVDEVARQGTLPVASAGNSGPSAYTMCSPGAAKNSVAVGALYADTSNPPYPWMVTSYSSRGPTADGRTKPDITAIGDQVRSTIPPTSTLFGAAWGSYYGTASGTSMAAPQVSGAVADLASGRPNAQTDALKGLLLGTWTTEDGCFGGSTCMQDYNGNPNPSANVAGNGFLQADDIFHNEFFMGTVTTPQFTDKFTTPGYTSVGPGQNNDYSFYLSSPYFPIRAVLTWLDPSTNALSLNCEGVTLHDLDLYLINPKGTTVASSTSCSNNVEIVDYLPSADMANAPYAVGVWKIRVHYYSNRLGSDPTQHYAVVLRGGNYDYGASVAAITASTVTGGLFLRPTGKLVLKDTLTNYRADSVATGGGPRRIEVDHWLWSSATDYAYLGWNTYDLNPGQTLTPTISISLAPYNLPTGTYYVEEDAFTLYPTNGAQFTSYVFLGGTYAFGPQVSLTPAMAANVASVSTTQLNYLRGQPATVKVIVTNVGSQAYTGTITLMLTDPSGAVLAMPVVVASRQVSIGVGATLTVTMTVTIPSSLPAGPYSYRLVASTGTQGWISSATTTVIIT